MQEEEEEVSQQQRVTSLHSMTDLSVMQMNLRFNRVAMLPPRSRRSR